jgi:hypothetical protein
MAHLGEVKVTGKYHSAGRVVQSLLAHHRLRRARFPEEESSQVRARARHPDPVALDTAVQVTAAAMLLVESPTIIKQGEHRAGNISPTTPGGDA